MSFGVMFALYGGGAASTKEQAGTKGGGKLFRGLLYWQLDQSGVGGRLPVVAKEIAYEPTWERTERRAAIEQWKKLLGDGNIPMRAWP